MTGKDESNSRKETHVNPGGALHVVSLVSTCTYNQRRDVRACVFVRLLDTLACVVHRRFGLR
jgi:hypothetical protein